MSEMNRIELGPQPSQVRVVASDQAWVDQVANLSGTPRRKAIEPTLRGYYACRMQRARMLRELVRATPEQEAGLRATLEALGKLPWDPGTRVEIQTALRTNWEATVTGHQADLLRRVITRCMQGSGKTAMSMTGTASTVGPQGSRDAALAEE